MLAPLGLRLSPTKTRVCHLDEGFDFLGFHIQRRRKKGTSKFGRVSGVFIAFLIPFLDIGIGQSPMLRGEPAAWAQYLPGYGGTRLVMDGALTASFDETRALLTALGWIAALTVAVALVFRRTTQPAVRVR